MMKAMDMPKRRTRIFYSIPRFCLCSSSCWASKERLTERSDLCETLEKLETRRKGGSGGQQSHWLDLELQCRTFARWLQTYPKFNISCVNVSNYTSHGQQYS